MLNEFGNVGNITEPEHISRETKSRAVTRAKETVDHGFKVEAANRNVSDESDSDDCIAEYGRLQSSHFTPTVNDCTQEQFNKFVECLPYCVFLTVGFGTSKGGKEPLCCCPCGRRTSKWREQFGVSIGNVCVPRRGHDGGQFTPLGLMQHMDAKKKGTRDSLFHAATLVYLDTCYP